MYLYLLGRQAAEAEVRVLARYALTSDRVHRVVVPDRKPICSSFRAVFRELESGTQQSVPYDRFAIESRQAVILLILLDRPFSRSNWGNKTMARRHFSVLGGDRVENAQPETLRIRNPGRHDLPKFSTGGRVRGVTIKASVLGSA